MKKVFIILTLSLYPSFQISAAAESATAYTYALAHRSELNGVLNLYEAAEGTLAANNIVIMPYQVRRGMIDDAIKAEKIFVASHGLKVVGLKKFYELTGTDKTDTLENEIRCIGTAFAPTQPNAHATFEYLVATNQLNEIDGKTHTTYREDDLFFYNGADLTHAKHRNKGINAALTAHALEEVAAPIITERMKDRDTLRVHFVYGLSHENQGGVDARAASITSGRTAGIAKVIAQFLTKHTKNDALRYTIARFTSEKPEFEYDETNGLQIITTGKSNGDGFVISCKLKNKE